MSDIVPLNPVKNEIKFTKDQEIAINGIIEFIGKKFDTSNFVVGLNGAGGTGKTFITNYIIRHCKYSDSLIKCTSSTHKACRVLSEALHGKAVDTIQSTFGFRLDLNLEDFDPINPQFNPKSSPKLDNVKLLIVDESSMLSASLVTYICNTCKDLNIKLLFIGDASQLAPVKEAKSIAFARCNVVYTLKEVVRQAAKNPITNLLQLLREDIDKKSYSFINYVVNHVGTSCYNEVGEGFSILNPRDFKQSINISFSNEEYTKNIDMYRIIAYTNNRVSAWNNYIRNNIIRDADKAIINKHDLIMSYETIVDEFLSPVINNSEEYIIKDIVNFNDQHYGFKGYLVTFQLVHGGAITKPLFIIDHKDRNTIGLYIKILTDLITTAKNATGATRTTKWKSYFEFKKKYLLATNIVNAQNKIIYDRDLDYGFAITAHKSQGSTYDNVYVDVNDMIYDSNGLPYDNISDILRRLYVACSRAKKELILCYGE